MLLVRHGIYFAIGIYLWLIDQRRQIKPVDYLLLSLAIGMAGLEIYSRAAQIVAGYAVGTQGPIGLASLVASACACFAVFVGIVHFSLRHARAWTPSGALAVWLRTLGLVTYPYYLIHEVFGGAVLHAAVARGHSQTAGLVIAIACIGAVAGLIALYGEPFLRERIRHAISPRGQARNRVQD
jgi:exopolysaccharide production protein ExoZ